MMEAPQTFYPGKWCSTWGLCLLLAGIARTAEPVPPLSVHLVEVPLPALPAATEASLARAADGSIWLAWLEPIPRGRCSVRYAKFGAARYAWSTPITPQLGREILASIADTPALAALPDGHLTTVWATGDPVRAKAADRDFPHEALRLRTIASESNDNGATWGPPWPLARDHPPTSSVIVQGLADNRVLAAWVNHPERDSGKVGTLWARIVGSGSTEELVAQAAWRDSQLSSAAFPDGSAILAYTGPSGSGRSDIYVCRFREGRWEIGRGLRLADWLPGNSSNAGPQLASAGGRAALVWCTGDTGGGSHVVTSLSPDAGGRFLQPLRIDSQNPVGGADALVLNDGTILVAWYEGGDQSGLWLRRITPTYQLGSGVLLSHIKPVPQSGYAHLALIRDDGAAGAQFLVVFADGEHAALRAMIVTLPDRAALARDNPCVPCNEEDADAARGYPMRGRIVSVLKGQSTLIVDHEEIPGVMRAMTMELLADPAVLAAARPGREVIARIERRGKPWWIFDVRWLGAAP